MTKEKIRGIIAALCAHEINKDEAVEKLVYGFMTSSKSGNIKAALKESVAAIHFADDSDYLSYHWAVVRHLSGVEDLDREKIAKMFNSLNPE